MITKWVLSRWNSDERIKRVECERETSAYVWVIIKNHYNGRVTVRKSKKLTAGSVYENFYNSWEEAQMALTDYLNREMARYYERYRNAQILLNEAKNLKKPDERVT